MSEKTGFDRRAFLRASGVVATGAAVAGCTDTGGDGQEPADGNDTEGPGTNETDGNETTTDANDTAGNETDANETAGNETDANETAGNETDANETAGNESAGNQSGGVADTVEVIAGPEGEFVFEPAELSIDPGTRVLWIWESDLHNVVPTSQPQGANWEGHETIEDAGFEYEHTFETTGTYEYVCEPHQAQGMTGTITVE
ncbi:plastocyanin/azurin family copper-binding protein [Natronoarchaeum mannanilyticum]|uniref:Blue (type 1) copper domain-containing protein n=1 Tax=Natronoarchaeum mannanilyticum TaxID=926360 RepID=A0AAV3TE14_9EURY